MNRPLAASSLLLLSSSCLAGGTLDEGRILRLLDQKPQIKEFVVENFDMPRGAWAETRLGSHFKQLGGERIGPYTVAVTPKGSSGSSSIVLTLCTTHQFISKRGNPINEESDDIFDATDVKETLVSVQIRQANEMGDTPRCP